MPTPIIFTITDAGRLAALDALNTGLTLSLTELGIGTGQYTPTAAQTALQTEVARFPLSGGDVEQGSQTLQFSAVLESGTTQQAFEVGLFSSTGVLFAVSSTVLADPLVLVTANISFIASFGLVLTDIPANVITVVTDLNAPLALVLHQQHLAAPNPHPQYTLMALFQQIVALLTEDIMATQFQILLDKIDILAEKIEKVLPKVGDIKHTGIAMTAAQFTAAQARGVWEVHSAGRVLVGAGTTTDVRGEELTFAVGGFGGEFRHVQTEAELRAHKHSTGIYDKFNALVSDVFEEGDATDAGGLGLGLTVLSADNGSPETEIQVADISEVQIIKMKEKSVGNSDPMNVMQPYVVACCFICTAI